MVMLRVLQQQRQQQAQLTLRLSTPAKLIQNRTVRRRLNTNNNGSSSSATTPVQTTATTPPQLWRSPPSATAFGIGALAGALGSMAGMGGGFVMIPLMTSNNLLKLSQHQAHGTSLFAVTATGLAGALALQEHVHGSAALAIAATAVVTARWGAQATRVLSERALKRALGVLLLIMGPAVPAKAYYMEQQYQIHDASKQQKLVQQQQQPDGGDASCSAKSSHSIVLTKNTTTTTSKTTPTTSHQLEHVVQLWKHLQAPALIGVASGFLAGLFGVGGGTLVVPALTYAMGSNQDDDDDNDVDNSYYAITTHHQALATSLAAMTLPAAVGTWTHARQGNVAVRVAPPLALGALCGAYVGGKLAVHTDESILRYGFSILLTVLGIRTLYKA